MNVPKPVRIPGLAIYQRKLHTKVGEVTLKVPKLRQHKFETAIISATSAENHRLKRR